MRGEKYSFIQLYVLPISLFVIAGLSIYFYQNFKTSRDHYIQALKDMEKKDYYHATEHLQAALYFDDDYSDASLLYAKIYCEQLKDYKYALSILNGAISDGETNGVFYYLRGKCAFKVGIPYMGKAKEDFEKAKSLSPEIDSIYIYLGQLNTVLKNYQDAVSSYSEALNRFSNKDDIYFKRGACYYHLGQYKKAIDDMNAGLMRKRSGEAYFLRAKSYLMIKDTASACVDFANAISNDYERARAEEEIYCIH